MKGMHISSRIEDIISKKLKLDYGYSDCGLWFRHEINGYSIKYIFVKEFTEDFSTYCLTNIAIYKGFQQPAPPQEIIEKSKNTAKRIVELTDWDVTVKMKEDLNI